MVPIRVVVTDYIEADLEWERARLTEAGIELAIHQLKSASLKECATATSQADVIIVNLLPITAELVACWQRCRLVLRHGVGYDNVDVAALTARGIRFANVPDYCIDVMAEQTMALLLAAARRLPFSRKMLERSVRLGAWDLSDRAPMFQLRDKTLGVVGCGRIGSCVVSRLASFGMNILVCDPFPSGRPNSCLGYEPVPLEALLRQSDYVTLHAALNEQTRGMINAAALAMMKPTAWLINTARAGLIDQPALVAALEAGVIGGAALDVFDPEPPPPGHPLLELDNVILTPHLGWYSIESEWDIRRKLIDQVLRFAAGEEPLNWVNRAALAEHASSRRETR